ncbi:GntR family transcriptional regulator [Caballeronia sp. GAFFF1]|uniref:GntR family transcriptional regulator n=1 Tax=Caballeronia sp. GAFFF1 TaxID=2921779 RepID=UPI002027FB41|nr:GntR family transcriptional regulator [Caballeronia sp. GAFFF1]
MRESTSMTLQERIAGRLADRIVKGELQPGEWLRQDAIAAEFTTSHVPVREAFRRLESKGLVQSVPRRGVRVADLDEPSIVEITRMRAALETLAMRVAMPLIQDTDIAAATAAIERANRAVDIEEWERCNREFHEAISRPCAMPRLLQTIDELHVARLRYMYATAHETDWDPQSQEEHCQILDAIRQQDVTKACACIERHILDSVEILINALRDRQRTVKVPVEI